MSGRDIKTKLSKRLTERSFRKFSMQETTKQTFARKILGWVGYLAILGGILYFFAPPSWFQFGVTSARDRKQVSSFKLNGFEDAKDWNFADKRGKVLLVNYWATWCGPCRFETPGLVNISEEFKDKDFEIVGVTVDENLKAVSPFIESYKISYPILLPGNDPNLDGSGLKLPTTFLYDKQGRLAKKYTGMVLEMPLRSDINSLLDE